MAPAKKAPGASRTCFRHDSRLEKNVMSTPSPAPEVSAPFPSVAWFREEWRSFLTPYYLTVAAVLGGVTVLFVVVTAVLVLIATNFNVLGWWE